MSDTTKSVDDALYQKITDICFEHGAVTKPMVDQLYALFAKQLQEARKEGRKQMGEKIKRHSERADFFNPEAKVVLADTFAWLSGLDEDTKGETK